MVGMFAAISSVLSATPLQDQITELNDKIALDSSILSEQFY